MAVKRARIMSVNSCQTANQWTNEVGQLVCELTAEGRIVSIFDKAVNILIPQELLVSLVRHTKQMTPMSVKCPAFFEDLRSRQLRLRLGEMARIGKERLTIGNRQIDLKTARSFQGFPACNRLGWFEPDKMSACRRVLCLVGRKGGLLGLLDEKEAENPFVQKGLGLRDGLIRSRRSRMVACLTKFVGLGVGFTPAGDDLICGFLLGQKVLGLSNANLNPDRRELKPEPLSEEEKRSIWTKTAQTNAGGRTLIWMALQGRFPGFLLDAVAGLSKAQGTPDIFRVLNTAVSRGHTSGTDALVGFLLYLQMFDQENKKVTGCEF